MRRHIDGIEHRRMSKSAGGCKPVSSYFKQPKTLDKVISAEVLFTGFLLEPNLPFEAASHAGQLFRMMFPDSEIAKVLQPKQQLLLTMPLHLNCITHYITTPSV